MRTRTQLGVISSDVVPSRLPRISTADSEIESSGCNSITIRVLGFIFQAHRSFFGLETDCSKHTFQAPLISPLAPVSFSFLLLEATEPYALLAATSTSKMIYFFECCSFHARTTARWMASWLATLLSPLWLNII